MTLNDQLTMTSVSIVDCLVKADSNSLDTRYYRQLIDTLIQICGVQASMQEYEPRTTFSTQYQSSLAEAAATILACSKNLTNSEFLKYLEKVHCICAEDSRICDAFKSFHGPYVSREDRLTATAMEFGVNAQRLMKSILDFK
jgi:hypothetical protein